MHISNQIEVKQLNQTKLFFQPAPEFYSGRMKWDGFYELELLKLSNDPCVEREHGVDDLEWISCVRSDVINLTAVCRCAVNQSHKIMRNVKRKKEKSEFSHRVYNTLNHAVYGQSSTVMKLFFYSSYNFFYCYYFLSLIKRRKK